MTKRTKCGFSHTQCAYHASKKIERWSKDKQAETRSLLSSNDDNMGVHEESSTVVTTDCNAELPRVFCSVMGCKGPEFLAPKQRLREQEKASDSKVYSIGDVTQKSLLFGTNTHLNATVEPDKANSRHHGYCLVIVIMRFFSSDLVNT